MTSEELVASIVKRYPSIKILARRKTVDGAEVMFGFTDVFGTPGGPMREEIRYGVRVARLSVLGEEADIAVLSPIVVESEFSEDSRPSEVSWTPRRKKGRRAPERLCVSADRDLVVRACFPGISFMTADD